MTESIERLARILESAPPKLVNLPDPSQKPGPDRWSKQEILGHLIDSVGNNHQRFVRAQVTNGVEFPEYEQNDWVRIESFNTAPWPDLVNLWLLLNRHLLHIWKSMPEPSRQNTVKVGHHSPMTLAALAASYLDHLEHHLEQILEPRP